ncbi:VRR-NUC domain-containing protein [Aureimonas glaciei]|uniref:VRR-NUC domain-containing protein n=1 Tax=Aureimonas glaciei TaxID=1776957 RepID=A0A916Y5S0_9HYPH|nr:VRR-NUC domain-containing protein [Aureimonas glaciei]GGD30983.1 hypothetical protein GCM10011335_37520 [Aureimonas glaciei]
MSAAREDAIHAGIVQYIRLCHPDCLVWHTPNGGRRDKREAAKLKWLGVLPGVPDLIIMRPMGLVYFMEVKGPKGVLSADQNAFRNHCERHAVPWALVHSIDEAREALKRWRLVGREVPSDAASVTAPTASDRQTP